MGKGDKKTKRGKIYAGSYGRRRPRKKSKMVSQIEAGTTPKK
ncbi:MAG: 30S ribosomal protein THX [Aquimarina sp.]|nr:30S ribosomal protein THX [Aquimarina sp.]